MRFSAGLLSLVFVLGCDGKVEEIKPTPDPLTGTATGATQKRCVVPLGSTPKRPQPAPGFVDPRCPSEEEPGYPPAPSHALREANIVFSEAPNAPTVHAEIAEEPDVRTRGLMYRRAMAKDHGMIFVFEDRKVQRFWMHNTCISLDMLFIDKDGFIAGIEENANTISDNTFSCGCPTTYVLEVNAGWSREHGVAPGQKVKIEGI